MADIPLTRCQFLLPFLGILDDIGAPTSSLLERFHLPVSLEEKSDLYIPLLPTIHFVEAAQRTQGIDDFGFLATQRVRYSHIREGTRALIAHSPTLLVALRHACKWASREDTVLSMWMEYDADHVRICSRLAKTKGFLHLDHAQWLQNIFAIHIVRQFAGLDWTPATIAFEAHYTPGAATRASWPNVRFLSGQHAAWIDLPVSHLSLSSRPTDLSLEPQDQEDGPSAYDIVELLKLMLPAYLDERVPAIADVAQMAAVSTRTFQRKLSHLGLSYSDILDTVRYENASKLLRDTDAKIIDVSFASGYTDPAHFSRAFRRICGVTPRQFREQSRMR